MPIRPPIPCPRQQVVCRACDAIFLCCVCGLQHTVTYLAQCRLCPPEPVAPYRPPWAVERTQEVLYADD